MFPLKIFNLRTQYIAPSFNIVWLITSSRSIIYNLHDYVLQYDQFAHINTCQCFIQSDNMSMPTIFLDITLTQQSHFGHVLQEVNTTPFTKHWQFLTQKYVTVTHPKLSDVCLLAL